MMKKLFARVVLLADATPSFDDKVKYLGISVLQLSPIAFALDWFNLWIQDNRQFGFFMCLSLIINMIVGVWYHLEKGTFEFKKFLLKNVQMGFVIVIVYTMLEMLRYTAGDNLAGEIFKVMIQITTLLYPTSKVMKNIYILTDGRHPPRFIMKRLYNFEKHGDMEGLFKTDKNNENYDNFGGGHDHHPIDELFDFPKGNERLKQIRKKRNHSDRHIREGDFNEGNENPD